MKIIFVIFTLLGIQTLFAQPPFQASYIEDSTNNYRGYIYSAPPPSTHPFTPIDKNIYYTPSLRNVTLVEQLIKKHIKKGYVRDYFQSRNMDKDIRVYLGFWDNDRQKDSMLHVIFYDPSVDTTLLRQGMLDELNVDTKVMGHFFINISDRKMQSIAIDNLLKFY